jgi:hypothetical protein
MGIFGGDLVEKALQLYFRDDLRFVFRRLELEDTFLEQRNKDKTIVKGWKHFYKNQFPFVGYKNIPAGMVTLSFGRDVILDPYGLVPEAEKPDKGIKIVGDVINSKISIQANGMRVTNIIKWLVEVGTARRRKIMAKRHKGNSYDRLILFLGSSLMLEIVLIVIILLQRRAGAG